MARALTPIMKAAGLLLVGDPRLRPGTARVLDAVCRLCVISVTFSGRFGGAGAAAASSRRGRQGAPETRVGPGSCGAGPAGLVHSLPGDGQGGWPASFPGLARRCQGLPAASRRSPPQVEALPPAALGTGMWGRYRPKTPMNPPTRSCVCNVCIIHT